MIKGFSLTEVDYDDAVALLKKRFARPDVIRITHINELINLAPVFSEKNVQRLRSFHDETETHFRAMEAQGVEKLSYSSVVVPMLMAKIPESLRNNMIRFNANHMEWLLDDFLVALEKELEVLEGHVPILQLVKQQQNKVEQHNLQNRPRHTGTATATTLLAGKREEDKNCPYCKKNHDAENCEEVRDITERKNVLLRRAKCFSCLKSGHRVFKCRSRVDCRLCKKSGHHVSICPILSAPSAVQQAQPKPNAPPLNPSATSWVGSTDSSEGKVALQTALAVINGKKECSVRVLFDTGSHKSFITAEAVGKLGLRLVRRQELGIKVFGGKEAVTEIRDVVEISLSALNDEKSVKIEAFVVKDISTIPNVHVERVKKDFLHLTNVWFSDVSRDDDMLEVDCLVGSDWLWSFQEGETIRGGQKSQLQ